MMSWKNDFNVYIALMIGGIVLLLLAEKKGFSRRACLIVFLNGHEMKTTPEMILKLDTEFIL